MEFTEIIHAIKQLDYGWFLSKKKFFEMEKQFVPGQNLIVVNRGTFFEKDYDENTGELIGRYESYIDDTTLSYIGFTEYCWDTDFENSLLRENTYFTELGPEEKFDLPIDVKPTKHKILIYLEELFAQSYQLEFNVPKLTEVMEILRHEVIGVDHQSFEFKKLKIELFTKIQGDILEKYGNWLELYKPQKIAEELPSPKKQSVNEYFPNEKVPGSFEYIEIATNGQYITNLLKSLIEKGFIEKSTALQSFRCVFFGKEVVAPLIWTGTKSELAYFIKLMLPKLKSQKYHWFTAANCFRLTGYASITAKQLHDAKKPATYRKIENAISVIK